jgi:hypothetical protein
MVIWYILPVLVSCSKKNLATLMYLHIHATFESVRAGHCGFAAP